LPPHTRYSGNQRDAQTRNFSKPHFQGVRKPRKLTQADSEARDLRSYPYDFSQ
jgi:hypothetical protein